MFKEFLRKSTALRILKFSVPTSHDTSETLSDYVMPRAIVCADQSVIQGIFKSTATKHCTPEQLNLTHVQLQSVKNTLAMLKREPSYEF